MSVGEIQSDKRINIVMQQGAGGVHVNPDPDIVLEPGDTILVIAPMEALLTLESMNQPHAPRTRRLRPVADPTCATSDSWPRIFRAARPCELTLPDPLTRVILRVSPRVSRDAIAGHDAGILGATQNQFTSTPFWIRRRRAIG